MRIPYKGEQPFELWLQAWTANTCERLIKMSAKNMADPSKNLAAITVIVSNILSANPDASFADVKDEAKYACQRRSLGYDSHVIGLALDAATRQRRML